MGSPVVQTREGKVTGTQRQSVNGDNIFAFHGIRYGKAPVGDLRFKAPQPAEPWEGIYEAVKDGSASCSKDLTTKKLSGTEDCLFLNVFTKSLKPDKLQPVMVFIHGGAFICGSNDSTAFNPDFLLTEDVVLVTVNYRLGILGFLSLDDASLDIPGNAGLKDQVLALKWVRDNIASFGGDSHNVTIFGESAGAASVHYLLLSPSARGLFHKAILQSGCVLNPWAVCNKNITEVLRAVGKHVEGDKDNLELLSKMSAEEIVEMQELIFNKRGAWLKCFGPTTEKPNPTAFLTRNPYDVLKSGDYTKVPIIMGYNDLEGFFFEIESMKILIGSRKMGKSDLEDLLWHGLDLERGCELMEDLKGKIGNLYFKDDENSAVGRVSLGTDLYFLAGLRTSAELHLATSTEPVYFYRFSTNTTLNVTTTFTDEPYQGACHGDELGYLFKFPSNKPLEKGSLEERRIKEMVKLWTNFAKYSNPTPSNGEMALLWKPVEKEALNCLNIDTDLKLTGNPPEKGRLMFWKYFDQAFFGAGYRL